VSLLDLDVLFVDCQATGASPRGRLIELGWGRRCAEGTRVQTRLVELPKGERVPPAVARVTGISTRMLDSAVTPEVAWEDLTAEAATFSRHPTPTVIHFARFERPFLAALAAHSQPLDLVCTHEIACRLLPDLPRRSLRALSGYLGRGVGQLRRAGDHVEATAFVWSALVPRLEEAGIHTWDDLHRWLAAPVSSKRSTGRVWPMPRETRLALPKAPGVYRMLRTGGDVLYVGKAASLRDRVNSYFRQRHAGEERMLEMLSQARALSYDTTATALEAALLEADEIKRHRPPYNVALTAETREVWFASRDLAQRATAPSARTPLGPFPSALALDQFRAVLDQHPLAVTDPRWPPPAAVMRDGFGLFNAAHPELSRTDLPAHSRVTRLGARLWAEGRRDRDDEPAPADFVLEPDDLWTPARIQNALERVALRTALALRRARWLARFADVSIVWTEPGDADARLIVLAGGELVVCQTVAQAAIPPVPPGHRRSSLERLAGFDVAVFDRVRVLMTEVKRLVHQRAPVTLRFGGGRTLEGDRLARVFAWL
jgi:DNA polymerase-3 subunit epsilon